MKKIGDVTSTADKNGEWTNGNVAAGIAPTILEAGWLNSVQREILGVLTKAGIPQDKNNDTQLAEAISTIISDGNYATKTEVNSKLAKDQNGADIPDKPKFIENLGLPEKYQPKGEYATNTALNNGLNQKLDKTSVVQSTGASATHVMSQKAVTELAKSSTPVGTTAFYIGETAPNDSWLIMRGQKYDTAKYPEIYAILKSDTLPDGRGVALRGLDAGRGFDPDRELLSYQKDAMQKINGGYRTIYSYGSGSELYGAFYTEKEEGKGNAISGTSPDTRYGNIVLDSSRVTRTNPQNETVMKNLALNIIIKVK